MCNPSNNGGLKKMLDLSKPVMTKEGRKIKDNPEYNFKQETRGSGNDALPNKSS